MPLKRSALKKQRQDKKRHTINLNIKKAAKEAIKSYRGAPSAALLTEAFSMIDTAAKKHIFHPNTASRLKSRLSKFLKNANVSKTKETPNAKEKTKPPKPKKASKKK